jgi:hypothetical protein
MSNKSTVPGTGIDLYNPAEWNRTTVADGKWLQNNTLKPLYDNELVLASAIHSTSASLQGEVDDLKAATDVIDVVATYSSLQSWSHSVTSADVIKVLHCDPVAAGGETYSGQVYFRYEGHDAQTADPSKWVPFASLDPYYSESQINEMFNNTSAWIDTVSGNVWDHADTLDQNNRYWTENTVSANLHNEISTTSSTIDGKITGLRNETATASGTLNSRITGVYNEAVTASATLKSMISSSSGALNNDIAYVSGQLVTSAAELASNLRLPDHTSDDAGKTLTVKSNNTLGWLPKTLVQQIVGPQTKQNIGTVLLSGKKLSFDENTVGYIVPEPSNTDTSGMILTLNGSKIPVWEAPDTGDYLPPHDSSNANQVLALDSQGTSAVWSDDFKRRGSYDQAFTTSQQIVRSDSTYCYLYIGNSSRHCSLGISSNGNILFSDEDPGHSTDKRKSIIYTKNGGNTYYFNGIATSATNDSDGNQISSTYAKLNSANTFTNNQTISRSAQNTQSTLKISNYYRNIFLGIDKSGTIILTETSGAHSSPTNARNIIQSQGTEDNTKYYFNGQASEALLANEAGYASTSTSATYANNAVQAQNSLKWGGYYIVTPGQVPSTFSEGRIYFI